MVNRPITAVELIAPADVVNIFSLGKTITGDQYEMPVAELTRLLMDVL